MNGNVEQEILRLEEELREAEMRLDIAALDKTFADDIMVTAPIGIVVDKAAVTKEIRDATEKATIEKYEKGEVKVRAFGDTAVTSYSMNTEGHFEGTEIKRQLQITNVWMKRQGRWQIVARHTANLEQRAAAQGCG